MAEQQQPQQPKQKRQIQDCNYIRFAGLREPLPEKLARTPYSWPGQRGWLVEVELSDFVVWLAVIPTVSELEGVPADVRYLILGPASLGLPQRVEALLVFVHDFGLPEGQLAAVTAGAVFRLPALLFPSTTKNDLAAELALAKEQKEKREKEEPATLQVQPTEVRSTSVQTQVAPDETLPEKQKEAPVQTQVAPDETLPEKQRQTESDAPVQTEVAAAETLPERQKQTESEAAVRTEEKEQETKKEQAGEENKKKKKKKKKRKVEATATTTTITGFGEQTPKQKQKQKKRTEAEMLRQDFLLWTRW
jgi:hypothetical protein